MQNGNLGNMNLRSGTLLNSDDAKKNASWKVSSCSRRKTDGKVCNVKNINTEI